MSVLINPFAFKVRLKLDGSCGGVGVGVGGAGACSGGADVGADACVHIGDSDGACSGADDGDVGAGADAGAGAPHTHHQ